MTRAREADISRRMRQFEHTYRCGHNRGGKVLTEDGGCRVNGVVPMQHPRQDVPGAERVGIARKSPAQSGTAVDIGESTM